MINYFLALFWAVIIYALVYLYKEQDDLNYHYIYTIAYAENIEHGRKFSKNITFSYSYKGQSYDDIVTYNSIRDYCMPIRGFRYFIKVSPKKGNIHEFQKDKLVPDSISSAPWEGWDTLPPYIEIKCKER